MIYNLELDISDIIKAIKKSFIKAKTFQNQNNCQDHKTIPNNCQDHKTIPNNCQDHKTIPNNCQDHKTIPNNQQNQNIKYYQKSSIIIEKNQSNHQLDSECNLDSIFNQKNNIYDLMSEKNKLISELKLNHIRFNNKIDQDDYEKLSYIFNKFPRDNWDRFLNIKNFDKSLIDALQNICSNKNYMKNIYLERKDSKIFNLDRMFLMDILQNEFNIELLQNYQKINFDEIINNLYNKNYIPPYFIVQDNLIFHNIDFKYFKRDQSLYNWDQNRILLQFRYNHVYPIVDLKKLKSENNLKLPQKLKNDWQYLKQWDKENNRIHYSALLWIIKIYNYQRMIFKIQDVDINGQLNKIQKEQNKTVKINFQNNFRFQKYQNNQKNNLIKNTKINRMIDNNYNIFNDKFQKLNLEEQLKKDHAKLDNMIKSKNLYPLESIFLVQELPQGIQNKIQIALNQNDIKNYCYHKNSQLNRLYSKTTEENLIGQSGKFLIQQIKISNNEKLDQKQILSYYHFYIKNLLMNTKQNQIQDKITNKIKKLFEIIKDNNINYMKDKEFLINQNSYPYSEKLMEARMENKSKNYNPIEQIKYRDKKSLI